MELESARWFHRLERVATAQAGAHSEQQQIGGSAFAALPELIRSPYLLGVGAWVSLLSFGAVLVWVAAYAVATWFLGTHGLLDLKDPKSVATVLPKKAPCSKLGKTCSERAFTSKSELSKGPHRTVGRSCGESPEMESRSRRGWSGKSAALDRVLIVVREQMNIAAHGGVHLRSAHHLKG